MERGLILLAAMLMVSMAPGVHGTAHLSFAANGTEVEVERDDCGESKLCLSTPDDCDPTENGTCLFVSLETEPPTAPNGTRLSVGLRGVSQGYVAMGLTLNASEGVTMLFICAQNSSNNGSFLFRTMQRNNSNGDLEPTERRVKEIRGTVDDNVIRCEFEVPRVNATEVRMSHATTFEVLLGTGSFEGNMAGPFNISFRSEPLDITRPNRNMTTTVTPTPGPSTTSAAMSVLSPHAMLLLLSIITLSVAQRR